jgi:uncharacterized protein YjbI with pentapeptide repeats
MELRKTKQKLEVDDADLSGSSFVNVNLSGAVFRDINFSGTTIENVNLSGVSISDCNIAGATINGVAVTELFAAYRQLRSQ